MPEHFPPVTGQGSDDEPRVEITLDAVTLTLGAHTISIPSSMIERGIIIQPGNPADEPINRVSITLFASDITVSDDMRVQTRQSAQFKVTR